MMTINAVENAIVEALREESMTEGEIWRHLRAEMHPAISFRDSMCALGRLLKAGTVLEIVERDPHGAHTGMASLYTLASVKS